jgi:hypothetical protein
VDTSPYTSLSTEYQYPSGRRGTSAKKDSKGGESGGKKAVEVVRELVERVLEEEGRLVDELEEHGVMNEGMKRN